MIQQEVIVALIGLNLDDAVQYLQKGEYTYARNARIGTSKKGQIGIAENLEGVTLVESEDDPLPDGVNICIGGHYDKTTKSLFLMIYNSNNDHSVYRYDEDQATLELIYRNELLGFSKTNKITGISEIDGQLFWVTGINSDSNAPNQLYWQKAKKATSGFYSFNQGYDKGLTGVQLPEYLSQIKKPFIVPLTSKIIIDGGTTNSYLDKKTYQFIARIVYWDNEPSAWSSVSKIQPTGYKTLTSYNAIDVVIPTMIDGNNMASYAKIARYIDLAYREDYKLGFKICKRFNYPVLDTTGFVSQYATFDFTTNLWTVTPSNLFIVGDYIRDTDNNIFTVSEIVSSTTFRTAERLYANTGTTFTKFKTGFLLDSFQGDSGDFSDMLPDKSWFYDPNGDIHFIFKNFGNASDVSNDDTDRPYDDVPLKANALEINDGYIFEGNFLRGFDNFYLSLSNVEYLTNSTPEFNTQCLKPSSPYQYGIIGIDKYGRKSFVQTTQSLLINTSIQSGEAKSYDYIVFDIDTSKIPSQFTRFAICRTDNQKVEYFFQARAEHIYYVGSLNKEGIPLFVNSDRIAAQSNGLGDAPISISNSGGVNNFANASDYYTAVYQRVIRGGFKYLGAPNITDLGATQLWVDTSNFTTFNNNTGYVYEDGDRIKFLTTGGSSDETVAKEIDLKLTGQVGQFVICSYPDSARFNGMETTQQTQQKSVIVGDLGLCYLHLNPTTSYNYNGWTKIELDTIKNLKCIAYQNTNVCRAFFIDNSVDNFNSKFIIGGEKGFLKVISNAESSPTNPTMVDYDLDESITVTCATFSRVYQELNIGVATPVLAKTQFLAGTNTGDIVRINTTDGASSVISTGTTKPIVSLCAYLYEFQRVISGETQYFFINRLIIVYSDEIKVASIDATGVINNILTANINTDTYGIQYTSSCHYDGINSRTVAIVGYDISDSTSFVIYFGEEIIINTVYPYLPPYSFDGTCSASREGIGSLNFPTSISYKIYSDDPYEAIGVISDSVGEVAWSTTEGYGTYTNSKSFLGGARISQINAVMTNDANRYKRLAFDGLFTGLVYARYGFEDTSSGNRMYKLSYNLSSILNFAALIEIYRPVKTRPNFYYEIGEVYNNDGSTQTISMNERTGDCFYIQKMFKGKYWSKTTNIISACPDIDLISQEWHKDIYRANIADYAAKQTLYSAGITFSRKYIQNSLVNGLCSFYFGDYQPYPLEFGSITKLLTISDTGGEGSNGIKGNILLSIHEHTSVSIYINRNILTDAGGNSQITSTNKVLGSFNPLTKSQGCLHAESVKQYNSIAIYYNASKGTLIQYSINGLDIISDNKAKRYFFDITNALIEYCKTNNISVKEFFIVSAFDPYYNQYIITFSKYISSGGTFSDYGDKFTIIYNVEMNRFTTWADFYPEYMEALSTTFVSVLNGKLYIHNKGTDFNCNQFPDDLNDLKQYQFQLEIPLNINPQETKQYQAIKTISNIPFKAEFTDKKSQTSTLVEQDFNLLEGNWYAPILNNTNQELISNSILYGDNMRSNVFYIKLRTNYNKMVNLYSIAINYIKSFV